MDQEECTKNNACTKKNAPRRMHQEEYQEECTKKNEPRILHQEESIKMYREEWWTKENTPRRMHRAKENGPRREETKNSTKKEYEKLKKIKKEGEKKPLENKQKKTGADSQETSQTADKARWWEDGCSTKNINKRKISVK